MSATHSVEPALLPVPTELRGNDFTSVPSNPGVINVGIAAGELPVRTVVITVRDSTGAVASTTGVQIAQNFLTGYGVVFSPLTCPGGQSGAASPVAQACRGGTTAVQMRAVFNGNLVGNRVFRLEVLRGNLSLLVS